MKLHVGERIAAAAKYAYGRIAEGVWGSIWSFPGVMLMLCLGGVTAVTIVAGGRRDEGACLVLPLAGGVAFVLWLVVGLSRWETKPPAGHVEVRDDALLCRFEDGSLVDLSWSEVVDIRQGDAGVHVLLVEHGPQLITELRGSALDLCTLRAAMGAALERYLPVQAARKLLARDGKPISDWLASVRAKFQPGAYRTAPPPLSRDQLVRLVLCPRLSSDERIGAAAALSVIGGQERNALARLRLVTGRVESPALRIAAERAMVDALDEAALAEAAAETPGRGRLA